MEEPTQQPNDHSTRQADSIETEAELYQIEKKML